MSVIQTYYDRINQILAEVFREEAAPMEEADRKSTRLNSSHVT